MGVIVALLSAVDVGGRKALSADLKRICADLGWTRVETLLASGNIIADIGRKPPASVAADLEAAIRAAFGFESAVIVRDRRALEAVIDRVPFTDFDPSRLMVHFLKKAPNAAACAALAKFAAEKSAEPYVIDGAEIFIRCDAGIADSRLTAQVLKRHLGTPGTARNWNTVAKLHVRALALESA